MRQTNLLSPNAILLIVFGLSMAAAGWFARVAILQLLLFLYVNVAAVLLPGYLMVDGFGFRFRNTTVSLFVGYGVGLCLIALLYAVLLVAGLHRLSPWFVYGLSLAALLSLVDKAKRDSVHSLLSDTNSDNRLLIPFLIFLGLFCFLIYQFPHRSVEETGYLDTHFDSMYWLKNSVASTKGYPLPELSVQGVRLYWHLFSCFVVATFHFSTGIRLYDLIFAFSHQWGVFLLLGSTYAVARELLNNRGHVWTAVLLICFCSSAEPYTEVYYLDHLLGCSMGTTEGVSMSLLSMLLLYKSIEARRVDWLKAALFALTLAATIGFKSPNGSLLMVGVFLTLVWLCLRNHKALVPAVILMLVCVLLFVVVCQTFIVVNDTLTSSTSNNRLMLNFMTVIRPSLNLKLVTGLEAMGVRPLITAAMLAIPYLLVSHPVMPLLAVTLVALLWKRRAAFFRDLELQAVCIPMLGMVVVGILLFLSLNHPGFAQSYFMFASIPFAVLSSFMLIEVYFDSVYQRYHRWLYVLMVCSLAATFACARQVYTLDGKICPDSARKSLEGTSLTATEFEGLRWASKHLPANAVVVTNKVLAPIRPERSFVTSVYTERQVYLEGYISANLPNDHVVADRLDLISRYFCSDQLAREQLRNEGVTHVIVYKSLTGGDVSGGKTLYENESIIIKSL